ncbi:MAG: hypothetical protein ACREA0_34080, partial [bacterium]
MKRRFALAALVAGVLIGYMLPVAFTPTGQQPSLTPVVTTVTSTERTPSTTTDAPVESTVTAMPVAAIFLVWATGGLPEELVDSLRQTFGEVSIVQGDVVELSAAGGRLIPLDALALDPAAHAFYDRSTELGGLVPGSVVLGQASARLRQAELGDILNLDGSDFVVVAVVSDLVIGAAEVAFNALDPGLPITTDRFALIRSDMARQQFEDLVRGLYDGPAPLRIRSEGET